MFLQPEMISSVIHPFVSQAYIKKDYAEDDGGLDVLVIDGCAQNDHLLEDFLSSMDLIADRLRSEGHVFDRIDIRRH